jgi:hypothetical protein
MTFIGVTSFIFSWLCFSSFINFTSGQKSP